MISLKAILLILVLFVLCDKECLVYAFTKVWYNPHHVHNPYPVALAPGSNNHPKVSSTSLHALARRMDVGDNKVFGAELMKHSLLTFDDEIELSKQYKLSCYINSKEKSMQNELGRDITVAELAAALSITEEQVRSLLIKGESAKKVLIRANMRLVFHIARHYRYRGVSYPDLIQEGTLGLMKAVEKYDGERGYRFSTYASWWIKQSISRAVAEKSRLIRLPVHIHDMMVSIGKVEKKFTLAHARKPTSLELAERLALPLQKVELLLRCARDVESTETASFIAKDGVAQSTIKERLVSVGASPIDTNDSVYLRMELRKVMDDLNDRESQVLAMRFGLSDGNPMTLEEVGKRFNVTRERIRQIEARALSKMRSPKFAAKMREIFRDDQAALSIPPTPEVLPH
eukprot:gene5131-5638_t